MQTNNLDTLPPHQNREEFKQMSRNVGDGSRSNGRDMHTEYFDGIVSPRSIEKDKQLDEVPVNTGIT